MTTAVTQPDGRLQAEIRASSSIELEAWCWSLTVSLAEATGEADRAFLGYRLGEVKRELRLRERVADPVAPLRTATRHYDLARIKSDVLLTDALPRLAAVELRKSAGRFVGRCPFPDHHDSSPSLSVDGDGQLWKCFGCGKGGDLFSFAQRWFGLTFTAAVEAVVVGMGASLDRYRLDAPAQGSVRRVV